MTAKTKDQLKALFESGDVPTAQDFIDLIDSFLDANQSNFPNPLPAVGAQNLVNLPVPAASTINVAEYNELVGAAQYLSSSSFNFPGNVTGQFPANRRVKLDHPAATSYLTVNTSSYDSIADKTIVSVWGSIANPSIDKVYVATLNPLAVGGSATPQTVGFTPGGTLVAANSLDVGVTHYSFDVSGNTNIQTMTSRALGSIVRLRFTDAPLLSHSAQLSLLGGHSHQVTAGDILEFECVSAGWRQVDALYQPAASQAVTYNTNWADYGNSYQAAGFYRDGCGLVHLEGVCYNTAGAGTGALIFTLPSGYRPANKLMFPAWGSLGAGRVDVFSDGRVFLIVGDASLFLNLSGIYFKAA